MIVSPPLESTPMGIRGWVYVISSEAIPGLVKVGFSTKDPQLRASELGGTHAPYPYVVNYDVLVVDPREIELEAHSALSAERVKPTVNGIGTEWFRCSPQAAIATLRRLSEGKRLLESYSETPTENAAASVAEEKAQESFYVVALRARRSLATRGGAWALLKRSLILLNRQTGRRFAVGQYKYDGETNIKGFAVKSREVPWVPLEEVDFVD